MQNTIQHVRDRCNRLRRPLARMSGLQCFNMGHNGHGINLYGVSMTLNVINIKGHTDTIWGINMQADNLAWDIWA